jgi:hypothetical protein
MQTEILHSQQTTAFNAVESFRQTEKTLFATLESNLTSAMSRMYGSHKTAFIRVLADVTETEAQINSLLALMVEKMTDVRNTYQTHDDTSADLQTAALSRSGSSNFSYGIW